MPRIRHTITGLALSLWAVSSTLAADQELYLAEKEQPEFWITGVISLVLVLAVLGVSVMKSKRSHLD